MIKISGASKSYKKTKILSDIDLEIISRGIVYLNGESGSGKTTFINCLSGLDKFDEGSIFVDEKKVDNLKHYCSFVFQDFQLIDKWSVKNNLLLSNSKCTADEVDKILDKLHISDIRDNLAYDISAGQKQRVAIARALLLKRPILIMDEPISNLDKKNAGEIFCILKELSKEILIIIVSHEEFDETMIDQKIMIENGIMSSLIINHNDCPMEEGTKNRLSFKKIFLLTSLFFRKSRQSFLSCIALCLCFSILSLELDILLNNKGIQTYNFYKTSGCDYVTFCNYDDTDNIEYISYKEKPGKKYFTVSSENDIEIKADDKKTDISSFWYKDDLLKENEIALSMDIVKSLELENGDSVEILGNSYIYTDSDIISEEMTKTLITSSETYSNINKSCCEEDGTIIINDMYVNVKNNLMNIYSFSEGEAGKGLNQVAITNEIKKLLESDSSLSISAGMDVNLPVLVNCFDSKYGFIRTNQKVTISGIIDSDERCIYADMETCDHLLSTYCSSSLDNGLQGYGIINPRMSEFVHAYNSGLIDNSVISDDYHIVSDYVMSYNGIILGFSVAFFVISLILIIMCIGGTITNNTKEMGVLLSLDYSRKYFIFILLGGVLIISLVALIVSVPLGNGIIHIMNMMMRKEAKILGSTLYYVWYIPFIELGIALLISALYLFIITGKMKKKNNIEIIYGK